MKTAIILCLALLSCQRLRAPSAAKQEVAITEEEATFRRQLGEGIEVMTLFFWPDQEFHRRHFPEGRGAYQDYLGEVARKVLRAVDLFDASVEEYFERGGEVLSEIAAIEQQREPVLRQVRRLVEQMRTLKREGKSEQAGELFREKKRLEQEELTPLQEREEVLRLQLKRMREDKRRHLTDIQAALDPQAVIEDEAGFKVDKNLQENWLSLYTRTPGQDNRLSFLEAPIHIVFGAWGAKQLRYSTKYQEGALAADSDIYDLSFSPDSVLRFKMNKRDTPGEFYSFELQYQEGRHLAGLKGDVLLSNAAGDILRRGQMKVLFPYKKRRRPGQ